MGDFTIEHPGESEHGDYATNVAMAAAQAAGGNPRELAEKIVAALEGSIEYDDRIEVAGPGFINFYMTRDFFTTEVARIKECGESWGTNSDWKDKNVIVEYTDPNPDPCPNPSPSSPMCCPGSLLSILWTCCGHGRSSDGGSTVERRRARTVQRLEGGPRTPLGGSRVSCRQRVSYEPTGLTPAATSCTSSYLVGLSGASSVCGVTPSPKNGGRRDYMFGDWRAAKRCWGQQWRPAARAAKGR